MSNLNPALNHSKPGSTRTPETRKSWLQWPTRKNKQRRVLIIVENLTVPIDRRVWQEASALRDAGYIVSIICPVGRPYTKSYEVLDGIHVFRHPLPFEAESAAGYAIEYASALFWEFILTWRVLFKPGFDVIQACNPPDTIFIIGLFYKIFFGKKFIFDHHDVNPELYVSKFGKKGFFHSLLLKLERATFFSADASIATNETFKTIAIERGKMHQDAVFVVQSTPDLTRFRRMPPVEELRNGRKYVVGYVGIMGAQDGVDLLLKAMSTLIHRDGRKDVQCVIIGSGTEVSSLKALAKNLDITDHITFTGYLSGEDLLKALSTFDVGVIPDPKNEFNDKVSMNKVFEYMALGIPFVQFDLIEGSRIAGNVPLYATNNDPTELADRISTLLDDADMRADRSERGKRRFAETSNWSTQEAQLLAAYDFVFSRHRQDEQTTTKTCASSEKKAAELPT